MGIGDKITSALMEPLDSQWVRLDLENGVTGFVVSTKFEDMPSLQRQQTIDQLLKENLTTEEFRDVIMIAGVTPQEYEAVGARIPIHLVKDLGNGSIEILLHGGYSDAQYIRGALNTHKGVSTSEPETSPGEIGVLLKFTAQGSDANPLTVARVIEILEADQYIHIAEGAAVPF